MTTLQSRISGSKTIEELQLICNNAEPKQENGEKTSFARRLNDVFWYIDLNTLDKKKAKALSICESYSK